MQTNLMNAIARCTHIEIDGRINLGAEFSGTRIQLAGPGELYQFYANTPLELKPDGTAVVLDTQSRPVNMIFMIRRRLNALDFK